MFATNCGTCHTLAAAGTDGIVGPNLDETSPRPRRKRRLEADLDPRAHWRDCGIRPAASAMPAGILQGEEGPEAAAVRRRVRRPTRGQDSTLP